MFTVWPGHMIAHYRRQGALYVHCDGEPASDGPRAVTADGETGTAE